jgi:8-oxo-dGTP pyrophosphatase MutT (NUDIX family)
MTKIYLHQKPIFLLTPEDTPSAVYPVAELDADWWQTVHQYLDGNAHNGISIKAPSAAAIDKALQQTFRTITAGGGVVYNEQGAILMIFRNGFWDLPKGKLDEGESIEECAVREVQEETGLQQVTLGKHLHTSLHTYELKGKHILKVTEWYEMHTTSQMQLIPQGEEGIEKAEWVQPDHIKPYLSNTYPSIIDALQKATALTI